MKAPLFVLAAASALAGCSDRDSTENQVALPVGTQIADNGVVEAPPTGSAPTIPTASGPGTAFGMTKEQLVMRTCSAPAMPSSARWTG